MLAIKSVEAKLNETVISNVSGQYNQTTGQISFIGLPQKINIKENLTLIYTLTTTEFDISEENNSITNNVQIDFNFDGNLTEDEKASTKVEVEIPPQELVISKEAEKEEVSIGKFAPYNIIIKNRGETAAKNVYIKDVLPPGFIFVEGSAKLVNNATDEKIQLNASGTKVIMIGPLPTINPGEEVEVTYLLKVGVGVKPGKYTNIAVTVDGNDRETSNKDTADIDVVPDLLFDSTTIIGKVFHDRDEDGIQDYAEARDVTVEIVQQAGLYVPGTTVIKQYKIETPIKDGEKIFVPAIEGRMSNLESPKNHMVVIRREVTMAVPASSIRVTTKDGTDMTLLANGRVMEKYKGDKRAGTTSQDIQITQRVVKNSAGKMFLDVYILNMGIQEEGLPGVRLATVDGIVMETDRYGRYHIPPVTQEKGKNLIIKVDPATLPKGSVFTTENPKVRPLGRVMMKYNFGVRLPELNEVQEKVIPQVTGKGLKGKEIR